PPVLNSAVAVPNAAHAVPNAAHAVPNGSAAVQSRANAVLNSGNAVLNSDTEMSLPSLASLWRLLRAEGRRLSYRTSQTVILRSVATKDLRRAVPWLDGAPVRPSVDPSLRSG